MDLHALSEFRPMLVVRGALAFIVGVVLVNQPEMSASTLVLLFGLWALGEGAATVRQGYPSSGGSRRAEAQPPLLVLGGVALVAGLLAVVVSGMSTGMAIWVLATAFLVRAAFEGLGAMGARARVRLLLAAAAGLDLGLVAILVTHTTGSVIDAAMFAGGLVALWGVMHLLLAVAAKPAVVIVAPGPRLLKGAPSS